jgi:hypothetical protein
VYPSLRRQPGEKRPKDKSKGSLTTPVVGAKPIVNLTLTAQTPRLPLQNPASGMDAAPAFLQNG